MTSNIKEIKREEEWISCRDVLWFLVFSGFAVNYMLRTNINLAIVAMVIPKPRAIAVGQCEGDDLGSSSNIWTNASKEADVSNSTSKITSFEIDTPPPLPPPEDYSDRFAWDEYGQGLVLGGYYWLHWLLQLPGGIIARRYGTKLVFGWGNFLTALLGLLAPFAAHTHIYFLVFIRVIQGFIAGAVWPSMHNMAGKWIPPNERSRFVSAYLGSSVGAAITYPLCAGLISAFGWESIFYTTSMFGVVWYVAWLFLAFDSPSEHPRISAGEKSYILESLGTSINQKEQPVPWKAILTSGPVWATIAAQWGGVWGLLTLMTQAPSYFNYIHGWTINATGWLSGLPHVMRMIFAYVFSIFADWLLRTRRMSRTNLRKLATFMCSGGQGILTLCLGLSGCQPILAVVFMIAATAVNGAVSAGPLANFVDLSPNYASILLGLSGTMTVGAGFISPIIVSILTQNNQTIGQWQIVFVISSAMLAGSCVCYLFLGTSEQQPWNDIADEEKGEELEKLRPKVSKDVKIVNNSERQTIANRSQPPKEDEKQEVA